MTSDTSTVGTLTSEHFDFDDLVGTKFPNFEVDVGVVEESTPIEDEDEELLKYQEEKYATKEDQDVAVFLQLAGRMSLSSLLHLLQGHARAKNLSFADVSTTESSQTLADNKSIAKPLEKKKEFRFALVADDEVRTVVHEVESYKRNKMLWWTPSEMKYIRGDLIDTIVFFKKHRPRYSSSIEILAKGNQSQAVTESHIRMLSNDSYARGLEAHIVRLLSDNRTEGVKAVLKQQGDCKLQNLDENATGEALREKCLEFSELATRFAGSVAQCDHVEALKASVARWK